MAQFLQSRSADPVSSLPRYVTKWLRWELTALFAMGAVFWGAFALRQPDEGRLSYNVDFVGVLIGPRIVAAGLGSHLYDLQVQSTFSAQAIQPYHRGVMPFVYPAYVAVVLRPLAGLSLEHAIETWSVINLTVFFWCAARLSRLFASTSRERFAILLVLVVWAPLQLTIVQGQMGMLPTLGFVECLIALRERSELRAGCWLSLGLLKPQLIIFPLLLFVIWRCWRLLAAFTLVLAGVVALSFATIGFWIGKYLDFLRDYNRGGAGLSLYPMAMQNWRGLASWLFRVNTGFGVSGLVVLLTTLSLVALWFVARGRIENDRGASWSLHNEAQYALAVMLGLLSSPHLYLHDWVAALPAGFALWAFARERSLHDPRENSTTALIWLLAVAPAVFFLEYFISYRPQVPLYMFVLVLVAIRCLLGASTQRPTLADRTATPSSVRLL